MSGAIDQVRPWHGQLPSTWELAPLGHLVRALGGCTPSKEEPRYWSGDIPWVTPKDMKRPVIDDAIDHVSADAIRETTLRLIEPPVVLTVVRGMILAHTVPVALTTAPVTVNQDMKALVAGKRMTPDFLAHALRAFQEGLLSLVEEAGHGTKRLQTELWKKFLLPVPPLATQRAIADFLDRKTAAIDALIEKKERLLALLEEKRQALITRAVTKGLDPSVPMKNSGIEWLGEIPAHWKVKRGRFLFQQVRLQPDDDDGVVTAFRDGQVTLRELRRADGFMLAEKEIGYQRVREGDLVLHSMDAFAGAIGVSEATGKCTPEYVVLAPRDEAEVSNLYYAGLLRVMALRGFVFVICPSVRERAPRFRFSTFKDVLLPVPPQGEQQRIMAYIAERTTGLVELRTQLTRQLALLREYRQALITAAVTGQLDVTKQAA